MYSQAQHASCSLEHVCTAVRVSGHSPGGAALRGDEHRKSQIKKGKQRTCQPAALQAPGCCRAGSRQSDRPRGCQHYGLSKCGTRQRVKPGHGAEEH